MKRITSFRLEKISTDHLQQINQILSDWLTYPDGSLDATNFSFQAGLISESIQIENAREKFFVAVDSNGVVLALVGYATDIFSVVRSKIKTNKPIQITVLMVAKDKTGLGIGTRVLGEFETWSKANGYTEIILTSSNRWKDSWSFYLKAGYHDIGEIENSHNFHTKIFRKDI